MRRASRAASGNPAGVLGIQHEVGSIEEGLAADLVVLDHDLQLTRVMSQGRWVGRACEAGVNG